MFIYILFYLFLILFSSIDFVKINKELKSKLFKIFFVSLVIFVGLRYKMANDWHNYLNYTLYIESLDEILKGNGNYIYLETSIEWGIKILISIINVFFNPENGASLQVLTFIVTLFNYTVLFKLVNREETIRYKFLFISTYIGFTLFREFDILRQSLTFYIFLLSLKYVGVNFKKYSLYNLIGVLFHSSAIIFFPLYWVFKLKFPKILIYILLFFHCFTMFIHFSFVSNILEFLGNYFPELIFVQKIYNYASEFDGGSSLSLVGILYAIYLVFLIINYEDLRNSSMKKNIYVNCFFIFIILNIVFSDSKEIADRFSYFFYFGLSYIFILVLDYFPKVLLKPYIVLVFLFPYIRFTRVISEPKTKSVLVPYRNYFFVTKSDEDKILSNWENKNEEFF